MTILNVAVSADRALLAVDTRVARTAEPDSGCTDASKLAIVPHAACILALRGPINVLSQLHVQLAHMPDGHFDRFADVMQNHFEWALRQAEDQGAAAADGASLVLVGRSRQHGRILGYYWDTSTPRRQPVGTQLAPWDQAMGPSPDCTTPESMLEAARKQVSFYRPQHAGFGGRLLVAELGAASGTRPTITINDFADL